MSKVIKLGNYKGIEFKVEKVPVSNEEVEQQIQMILAQSSQTEEKDGDTVENGDIATIDFVGLKDDVAFEGGTGNDYDLEIGSGSFIPGFEEQMIGMKVNETRDLNLTFPENYQAEDLAGQDVVFKVTVKKLSVKKEAELNDDFVEGLGVPEIKTVEDLKAYINEGLQQQHDQQYEAQKENTIFDAFMADSEVELDDDAIDEALDRQMSYMANQMMAQGIQLDQYLQMTGMDEEKLREQMKPSATQQAKLEALIDEIKTKEKFILFVDEIHTLINSNSDNALDFANMFKTGLGRGDIKVIGATTSNEYERYILKDKAFVRRFTKIEVEEPDREMTIKILMGTLPKIEKI